MTYIVRILMPEYPTTRGTYSRRFGIVDKIASDLGIILTGLSKEYLKDEIVSKNDLVIIKDLDPLSCFVAGIARGMGIKVIGAKFEVLPVDHQKMKQFCETVVQGEKELRQTLIHFVETGELNGED